MSGAGIERTLLPVFLGIGAPQSGTTWLHRNLQCHPDLFLPTPKEINFFDRKFEKGVRWYADHFREAEGRRIGEITPSYGALHPDRIRLVGEWMPDVRLVYLVRDPIDRAWSRARRRFSRAQNGSTRELGLKELRIYEANQSIAPGDYAPGVMKGDHAVILDNWLQEFAREQLLVLRFEDIALRPAELLGSVFAHLGVEDPADWSEFSLKHRINANPPAPMPEDCRAFLQNRYQKGIEQLKERFGVETDGWSS